MTLAVIPARGGSKGLLRKNLLPVDGTPMFLRSANAARDAGCTVIISTDDSEIASVATSAGYQVHRRGPELAEVTVDHVVAAVATDFDWVGDVLLVQPTVQPITADIVRGFLSKAQTSPMTMVNRTGHQIWANGRWVTERVNRQDMAWPAQVEVGLRWWPTTDDIGTADFIVIDTPYPLVDIDTASDYRSVTVPKNIAIWPRSSTEVGSGHIRRQLAIAERLQHHNVEWIVDDCDQQTVDMLIDRGWDYVGSDEPHDLWILDRLDNGDMPHLSGRVVAFEDTSQYSADLNVNALYDNAGESAWYGPDWCVLRPEFAIGEYQVRDTVDRIMVMFGGTDPHGIGERIARLFPVEADLIVASDEREIAASMREADLLITSAGRTVFEAAAVGVPTIVLAQNLREETHTHLGAAHGNVYLGQARLVSDRTIRDTVSALANDYGYRVELSETGRPDGLGIERIVHAIEGLLI